MRFSLKCIAVADLPFNNGHCASSVAVDVPGLCSPIGLETLEVAQGQARVILNRLFAAAALHKNRAFPKLYRIVFCALSWPLPGSFPWRFYTLFALFVPFPTR